jgi:hypothetical protein
MGRKEKRVYEDTEMVGLPPVYITGADYKALMEGLKQTVNKETGKPYRLGKYLEKTVQKNVAAIRAGKRIRI